MSENDSHGTEDGAQSQGNSEKGVSTAVKSQAENKSHNRPPSISSGLLGAVKEIGMTFVHSARAPRALWGINISYLFEGLAYFGMLTVLGKFLSEDVGMSDLHAGWIYSLFTGGITLTMLFLGGVSDKIGIRKAFLISLGAMTFGRLLLGASSMIFDTGGGTGSPLFFQVLVALFFVVLGYGMYQPAAYSGVKQFTDKKQAAVGYAMIYALMNLGAFFSGIISPVVRKSAGISAVFITWSFFTLLAFVAVWFLLTRKSVHNAVSSIAPEPVIPNDEHSEEEKEEEIQPQSLDAPQQPKRMLEPVTIALCSALCVFAGVLFYNIATQPVSPLQSSLEGASSAVDKYWADRELSEDGVRPTEVESIAVLEQTLMDKSIKALHTYSAGTEARDVDQIEYLDESAIAIAGEILIATNRLVSGYVGGARPLDVGGVAEGQSTMVRRIFRKLALANMAAAYGLAPNTELSAEVIAQLSYRVKDADEERFELTSVELQELAKIASLSPPKMLETLAGFIGATADELAIATEESVNRDLIIGLRSDVAFAHGLAGSLPQSLSPLSAKLLQEKLLVDANAAKDQAGLLKTETETAETGFFVRLMDMLSSWLTEILGSEQDIGPQISFASIKVEANSNLLRELAPVVSKAAAPSRGAMLTQGAKRYGIWGFLVLISIILLTRRILSLRPDHPFHNARFTFFIFILIPVQTLFAHTWLTIPYYINRSFAGLTIWGKSVADNFEFFSNLNPLLIFFLAPIVTVLTAKLNEYKMMMWGTLVMAAPTFLLVFPPTPELLLTYIFVMTVGEAMWQPRFLQIVAELAPPGKTGAYMGIGQLPWFMTKLMTGTYSGYLVASFIPKAGPQNPGSMWLIHATVAMATPIALLMAHKWMGSFLKRRHS